MLHNPINFHKLVNKMAVKKHSITIANDIFLEEITHFIALGKSVSINIKGNSMNPFLLDGEKILLKPMKDFKLSIGLIILAKYNNKMVLHRLIKFNKDTIWLAGDGNIQQIEQINLTDTIAVAQIVYRNNTELLLINKWSRWKGYGWFLIRPFRRIYNKIIKIYSNKRIYEIKK